MAREWRGPYPRKAQPSTAGGSGPVGIRAAAFNDAVLIREDGLCIIFNPVLRDLLLMHEHYRARDERIVVLQSDPRLPQAGRYVLSVLSNDLFAPPVGHEVKVKVENGIVHESGREELD